MEALQNAERGIQEAFETHAQEAARIRNGTSRAFANQVGELSPAQRATLADDYLKALKEWRDKALNLANNKFADNAIVQGPAGSGYGSRPIGSGAPGTETTFFPWRDGLGRVVRIYSFYINSLMKLAPHRNLFGAG